MNAKGNENEPHQLEEMMRNYLLRQASAWDSGFAAPVDSGVVKPYEATPVPPVRPDQSWREATWPAHFYGNEHPYICEPPEAWSVVVAAQEPAASVAFCLGNYPQLVRDLHALLSARELLSLRPMVSRPISAPGLLEWASQAKNDRQQLLAAGVLRLARQFDAAESHLQKVGKGAMYENEFAAFLWHQGRLEEAAALWGKQTPSVPVMFNRGMADLFLERFDMARVCLQLAVAGIDQHSAWHHLGQLYLTLARMH